MSTYSQLLGRKRGPRFKINRTQGKQILVAVQNDGASIDDIAREWGVTKQTIYNVIKRLRKEAISGVDPRWK